MGRQRPKPQAEFLRRIPMSLARALEAADELGRALDGTGKDHKGRKRVFFPDLLSTPDDFALTLHAARWWGMKVFEAYGTGTDPVPGREPQGLYDHFMSRTGLDAAVLLGRPPSTFPHTCSAARLLMDLKVDEARNQLVIDEGARFPFSRNAWPAIAETLHFARVSAQAQCRGLIQWVRDGADQWMEAAGIIRPASVERGIVLALCGPSEKRRNRRTVTVEVGGVEVGRFDLGRAQYDLLKQRAAHPDVKLSNSTGSKLKTRLDQEGRNWRVPLFDRDTGDFARGVRIEPRDGM